MSTIQKKVGKINAKVLQNSRKTFAKKKLAWVLDSAQHSSMNSVFTFLVYLFYDYVLPAYCVYFEREFPVK